MKPEIRKTVTRSTLFFGMPDTGNQLKPSRKMQAAPRGALLFYRRFVYFNAIPFQSVNDSKRQTGTFNRDFHWSQGREWQG